MLLQIIQIDLDTLSTDLSQDSSWLDEVHSSLRMKIIICSTMMRMFRTIREEHELIMKLKGFCPGNKIPKGILLQGPDAIKNAYERYTSVKSMDSINEGRPEIKY